MATGLETAVSDGDSELLRKISPSIPSGKGNIKRPWSSVNKPISEKDLNNELVMTMKSLRKEFQDLNQQEQCHTEKEETNIFTSNDKDKLCFKHCTQVEKNW